MDIQAEFQSLFDRYLAEYEAHDAQACASYYVSNGMVLTPWGPPVTGQEAIKDLHEEWFLERESDKVMTVIDAHATGNTGFCLGRYAASIPAGSDGYQRNFGASLNTLVRQPDGQWKIQHTSLNELENEETGFAR